VPFGHIRPLGIVLKDGKFDRLDIPATLTLLFGAERSFYGHYNVLFAGFAAWLLNPMSRHAVADAIAVAAARQMAQAEREIMQRLDHQYDAPQITALFLSSRYADFTRKIYHTCSGPRALAIAYQRAERVLAARRSAIYPVQFVIAMVRIFAFHHQNNPLYRKKPSIATAGRLTGELDLVPAGLSLLRQSDDNRAAHGQVDPKILERPSQNRRASLRSVARQNFR
jgi:hypothetical protein